MNRNVFWKFKHAVHNIVAHPLLPIAELLHSTKCCKISNAIYKFHDLTSPEYDSFNQFKFEDFYKEEY